MDFLRPDVGSGWSNDNMIRFLLREGKVAEARDALAKLHDDPGYIKFYKTCLNRPSPQSFSAEFNRDVRDQMSSFEANPDPENRYLIATDLAYCGEKDAALQLLKSAIDGKYCAYVAMQKDPMLASLRGTPEFTQLLSAAKQCQDNFLAERAQLPH